MNSIFPYDFKNNYQTEKEKTADAGAISIA
jgi:hypothetical protein